jgi:Fuc2NAc and GlcNAc transferase
LTLDPKVIVLLSACLVGTFLGVWLKRRVALSRGILDVPNARSSHDQPVPRGGGLALVVVVTIGLGIMSILGFVQGTLALALMFPGSLIAGIGYLDDLRGVSARTRLAVQLVAAVVALVTLGGWSPEWIQKESAAWLVLQGATVVGIVWSINLFNFMDGIDGLAGTEAAYIGIGAAWLMSLVLTEPGVTNASLLLFAASLGFLLWNWPPAKIFMGDVGSGYLGFVIAVLAVASARERAPLMFVWIILGAMFLIDAIVTLLRRLIRGERIYEAHRTHAYQWLARRFGRHLPVTLLYLAVNVLWLLPMAWLCLRFAEHAPWLAVAAVAPIIVGVATAGAGRPEVRPVVG